MPAKVLLFDNSPLAGDDYQEANSNTLSEDLSKLYNPYVRYETWIAILLQYRPGPSPKHIHDCSSSIFLILQWIS